MGQNEKTSKPVATIAAEILKMKSPGVISDEFWQEILEVAGSAFDTSTR